MDKEEKRKLKAGRDWQKLIDKFLRMARVPKNATYEQTCACILHKVRNMKRDLWKVKLPDAQMNDPDFLLKLYKANPGMTFWHRYSINKHLQSNADFMIGFAKWADVSQVKQNEKSKITDANNDFRKMNLKLTLTDCKYAMENPEFVARLAREFPFLNVVELIKETTEKDLGAFAKEEERQKARENFERIISKVPNEILCNQVRAFKHRAMIDIPNTVPDFNKLVEIYVEEEGFHALSYLDIEQVLDNKPLIMKAYQKEGVRALARYIHNSLSPSRTEYYFCHGEEHEHTTFDGRYLTVQQALMQDEEIRAIFEQEMQAQAAAAQASAEQVQTAQATSEIKKGTHLSLIGW